MASPCRGTSWLLRCDPRRIRARISQLKLHLSSCVALAIAWSRFSPVCKIVPVPCGPESWTHLPPPFLLTLCCCGSAPVAQMSYQDRYSRKLEGRSPTSGYYAGTWPGWAMVVFARPSWLRGLVSRFASLDPMSQPCEHINLYCSLCCRCRSIGPSACCREFSLIQRPLSWYSHRPPVSDRVHASTEAPFSCRYAVREIYEWFASIARAHPVTLGRRWCAAAGTPSSATLSPMHSPVERPAQRKFVPSLACVACNTTVPFTCCLCIVAFLVQRRRTEGRLVLTRREIHRIRGRG